MNRTRRVRDHRRERDVHHRPVRRREHEAARFGRCSRPDDPHPPEQPRDPGHERAERSGRTTSGDPRRSGPLDELGDDVVDVAPGRVDHDRVVGRRAAATPLAHCRSRPRRASAVAHVVDRDRARRRRFVELAAAGPLFVARGQEHLQPARPGTRPFRCRDLRPRPPPCSATHARWRATSTARTSGCAETVDTAAVTSGPRISALTSRPSIVVMPSSTRDRAARAAIRRTPARRRARRRARARPA